MVLGPGWPQRCPRSLQYLVGPPTQHPAGLTDHCLRVIPVDLPATSVGELGELLAVHDRVGPGLVGWATLDGDVLGEVKGPGPQRNRVDRHEQRGRELVKRSRRHPPDRCSHLRDQSGSGGHIQASALIVDGSRRHAGFDQLDPPTVHHRMVPRRRDRYGPAEMIRNAQVHKVTAWLKGRAVLEGPSRPPLAALARTRPSIRGGGPTRQGSARFCHACQVRPAGWGPHPSSSHTSSACVTRLWRGLHAAPHRR
jgi:hypothetical protein